MSDVEVAEQWYTALFGSPPHARPMEWHLGENFGVQVWQGAARAGRSLMVLDESDLDSLADRATAAGLGHDGPRR